MGFLGWSLHSSSWKDIVRDNVQVVICMEHISRGTLEVYSDAHPPTTTLAHPGHTEFHFGLGKKVKIFRFAIEVVELIGVKHMTNSAYKSQRSSTAYSVRRVRNVSV